MNIAFLVDTALDCLRPALNLCLVPLLRPNMTQEKLLMYAAPPQRRRRVATHRISSPTRSDDDHMNHSHFGGLPYLLPYVLTSICWRYSAELKFAFQARLSDLPEDSRSRTLSPTC